MIVSPVAVSRNLHVSPFYVLRAPQNGVAQVVFLFAAENLVAHVFLLVAQTM